MYMRNDVHAVMNSRFALVVVVVVVVVGCVCFVFFAGHSVSRRVAVYNSASRESERSVARRPTAAAATVRPGVSPARPQSSRPAG